MDSISFSFYFIYYSTIILLKYDGGGGGGGDHSIIEGKQYISGKKGQSVGGKFS